MVTNNENNTLDRFVTTLKSSITQNYRNSVTTEATVSHGVSAELMKVALDGKHNSKSTMSASAIQGLETEANLELKNSERLEKKANSPINAGSALANTSATLLTDWQQKTGMDDSKLILKVLRANARASGTSEPIPSREDIAKNPEQYAKNLAESLIPNGEHGSVDKGIERRFNNLLDKTLDDKEHPELASRLSKSSNNENSSPNPITQAKKKFSENLKNAETGMAAVNKTIVGLNQEGPASSAGATVQNSVQRGGGRQ